MKKFYLVGLVLLIGAVALLAAALVTATGPFPNPKDKLKGDAEPIVLVGSETVTRGAARFALAVRKAMTSDADEAKLKKEIITQFVENAALTAEAKAKGLMPTESEARLQYDKVKADCAGEHGQECRDFIAKMGLSFEEYWSAPEGLAAFRESIAVTRLQYEATSGVAPAERGAAIARLSQETLAKYSIIWKDPAWESIYKS